MWRSSAHACFILGDGLLISQLDRAMGIEPTALCLGVSLGWLPRLPRIGGGGPISTQERKRKVAVLPGDEAAPEAVYPTLELLRSIDLPIEWLVLPDGEALVETPRGERERLLQEAALCGRPSTVLAWRGLGVDPHLARDLVKPLHPLLDRRVSAERVPEQAHHHVALPLLLAVKGVDDEQVRYRRVHFHRPRL